MIPTSQSRPGAIVALALLLLPGVSLAQQQKNDSLTLAQVRAFAAAADPRSAQPELLRRQSALRIDNIAVGWRPQISLLGQAQYLSDVPRIPVQSPGVQPPPNDNYDAHVAARQTIYDATLHSREEIERAQLAESEARINTALYGTRQEVNNAFFEILLLQARRFEVASAIQDLEAQLANARERVEAGASLPSEALLIRAELTRRRQSVAELEAARAASMAVLSDLSGQRIDSSTALMIPELSQQVAELRPDFEGLRKRPEYAQFDRSKDLLAARQSALVSGDRPRISAFSRAGYGRPGLNPLARDFDEYWLAGVQIEWSPVKWGTSDRERQAIAVQQEIIDSEMAALDARIRRLASVDLATIDRLQASIVTDGDIIALREQILNEARLRYREGVITAAEYVDRETDLLAARVARAVHRVELAQASARFLTLIGQEVR